MLKPSPTGTLRHRYQAIDVLRGFAALWVVLSHYLPYWNKYIGPAPIIVPNSWGVYAVKLFFVISGLVIFNTLEKCRSVPEFAVLRFSRLYPAYWATLLLATGAGAILFGQSVWLRGLAANATMFQEFLGFPNFDNVYWSLTVELAFYLNVAWLFAAGLHRWPLRIVLVWLGLTCVWSFTPHLPGTDQRGWPALLFALDYSPYFAMGIVLFTATRHGWGWQRISLIAGALATEFLITGWLGLGIAAFIGLACLLAVQGHLKFLVSRGTLWLGTISYSLYLLHRNLGYQTLDWLHGQELGPVPAVMITLAGAFALSTAITYGVEKPAMRRIRLLYDQWKVRKGVSA